MMDINALTNDFTKTHYFKQADIFPKSMIVDSIKGFYQVLVEEHGSNSHKWTGQQIYEVFHELLMVSRADHDQDSDSLANLIYEANSSFFEYLAESGKLQLSADDMGKLLTRFENENYKLLVPDSDDFPLGSETMFDDPGLPQWREYVARDIDNYVTQWLEAYFESPQWQRQQHHLAKDVLELIVSTMAEKIYDDHRKTPKSWTKKAMRVVMCIYLVGNTDLSEKDYQYLVPEVSQFLDYVAKRGWLNDKKAANYQRYMTAIEPEMVAMSLDEDNFGPAKTISLEMRRQGIDVNDQAAVDKFIQELNAQGGVDALYDDDDDYFKDGDDPLEDDDPSEILDDPQQLAAVAKIYDPDPQQQYLNEDHLTEFDGRKWRKKVAIEVHQQAVEFGLRLWLTKKDVALKNQMDAALVGGLVCEFVDVMYAQHLQKPSEWTAESWYEFGDWLRQNSKVDNRNINPADVLAELATVVGEAGIISTQRAQQLSAAMLGEKTAETKAPTKVSGGKVISMKQARKLLRNKRR